MIKRANPIRNIDRLFRIRVRFERPPGQGVWSLDIMEEWLRRRLKDDQFAVTGEMNWEGHDRNAFAVHLDDESIIGDMIRFVREQKRKAERKHWHRCHLTRDEARLVRDVLLRTQGRLH